MQKERLVISALLVVLLLVSCAPKPSTVPQSPAPAAAPAPEAPAPAAPAPAKAAPAKAAWQVELDSTIEAAKKEGTVVLYTSFGAEARPTMSKAFQSKYEVNVEALSGTSSLFAPKIFAEQRAGIYSGDVWVSGSTTYRELPGALDNLDAALILPELTEPELIKKTWYFGEFPWANKDHTALISLMSFNEVICTNSTLVKSGEIKTYADILDPKWKGKISLLDPQVGGMGQMWFAVSLELGDIDVNYLRDLMTKQDVFMTRDRRLQVEWLTRGKHAIAVAPHQPTVTEFMRLGAPIDRFFLGHPFVSGSTSGIAMLKKQPHPNAAKLFINWILSKEGATVHSQVIGAQSQRLDVPTDHLEASKVLGPGLNVYRSDNEEFAHKRATYYVQLAKEVLGPFTK